MFYAAALASSRLREPQVAASWLARLTDATRPDAGATRVSRLLAAEIALDAGHAAEAAELVGIASESRPELMLGSQARLRAGRSAEVSQGAFRSRSFTEKPPACGRDAEAFPPQASIAVRTIARPRPVPPVSLLRDRSGR